MTRARILVVVIGMVLPYGVRLPRGAAWVAQYTDVNLGGYLLFGALNAAVWGSVVALSFLYRRAVSLWIPALFAFGYLGWVHYRLDLSADAQAAIALMVIPIYAQPFVAVGGALGYLVDRRLRRNATA